MTLPEASPTPTTDSTFREADFWTEYQPGFRFSKHTPGSPEFFAEVERHRYQLESHIPEMVKFQRWAGHDVLEVGCGIATDGIQFVRRGARYTGVDASSTALELARRRFAAENLSANLQRASATELPFSDECFDLVYSHGVIHHIDATKRAVQEFHRILRPGGAALVMVYHRNSLNYYFNIMLVRRLLAMPLLVPGMPRMVSRATGEDLRIVEGHRNLLRKHGWRYLTDRDLFLSNNTDGPGNPLSKVYTRKEAAALFARFDRVATQVRHLNLRLLPRGDRVARSVVGQLLADRFGWHLYVTAFKAT
jgi:ubiquinone/menaquinone biosynthesis C-methylase UbiE